MRVKVIAVGKNSDLEKHLCLRYQARLGHKIKCVEVCVSKQTIVNKRKQDEYKQIIRYIKPDDFIICLDERGQNIKSDELASLIEKTNLQNQTPTFIIGGADGLDSCLHDTSMQIAFGKQTWPHLLVRAMLFEQLYRAHDILNAGPYHRA